MIFLLCNASADTRDPLLVADCCLFVFANTDVCSTLDSRHIELNRA